MTLPPEQEPPAEVRLSLDEALELLGVLEDVRDALIETNHLTEVAIVTAQLLLITRRLGFSDADGDDDAD